MDEGVGTAAVPVGAGPHVVLRFLQVLLLHDLLLLDQAASAVSAIVLALLAGGAAAGAGIVILDPGADDLLFGLRAEAGAAGDPADEFNKWLDYLGQ